MSQTILTDSLPGRTVTLADGRKLLWFGGTDYLGMGHDRAFGRYLTEGMNRYGTHYGSSRNGSLRLVVFEEAEASLANFVGAPAALAVSSGMWAGQLVMKSLDRDEANFYYAPRVHPALWGKQYTASQGAWSDWARATITAIQESETNRPHVILTDSVGSPWAENFELELFKNLPDNRLVILVVDDSHGLGVMGGEGQSAFSRLPQKENITVIVTASLNKAMGVPGGVIFGNADFLDELRRSPFFAGSSPSAPAYYYALQQSLVHEVYKQAHGLLQENVAYFTQSLTARAEFDYAESYPAFCSRHAKLYPLLLENNILTSCFSYPLPTDAAITRLIVTALHQKKDLDRLAEVLYNFELVD